MSIVANKVKGIRAALCHDTFSARRAGEHNDANVLCLGAWVVGGAQPVRSSRHTWPRSSLAAGTRDA
jgi:ribose 5-phosphate isomerase B